MSIQAIGTDTIPLTQVRAPVPLLARMVVSVTRRIRDEVTYMVREDRAHGRINHDPRSWER